MVVPLSDNKLLQLAHCRIYVLATCWNILIKTSLASTSEIILTSTQYSFVNEIWWPKSAITGTVGSNMHGIRWYMDMKSFDISSNWVTMKDLQNCSKSLTSLIPQLSNSLCSRRYTSKVSSLPNYIYIVAAFSGHSERWNFVLGSLNIPSWQ